MCGIAGVYNYRDLKPVESTLCHHMLLALAHRGPDDDGLYFCDKAGVALGHRRLSITYLEPETIRQMLDDHQRRRQNHRRSLFSLLTFEIWHEQFITPSRWPSATHGRAGVAVWS
jgi:hypothetical protein